MKKRLVALLCLLAALVTLLTPWSLAAPAYEEVYLLGVNDTVLLGFINDSLMPVRRSGTIYAPYTILDNSDLGLSYALNRTAGTFTIFNRTDTLIFYLNSSGAVDTDDNSYTDRIIARNGVVFLPLRFVASFFGLSYSFYNLVLPEGSVPIARVCTDKASLSDKEFGTQAATLVASPLRQYIAAQASPSPSVTGTPSPGVTAPPAPSPSPSAQPRPVNLSFAVYCTGGGGFQTLLDAFASARCSALFLFDPADLAQRDADVRAAAAAGHQIGLLLPQEEPEAAFARGNELLRHILRSETSQVAFPDGGAKEGNWWVWSGNVFPRGGGPTAQADSLAQGVEAQTRARVTLNDSRTTAQALRRNLPAWSQRPYTITTPTETD